jgi:hypothetical protein
MPEFDQYCRDHSIITLCMPPHSSHLPLPLDVGSFAVLKQRYGNEISDLIRLGINHIDKPESPKALVIARNQSLVESNIKSSFEATGLVSLNPNRVLSTISRPQTPLKQTAALMEHCEPETAHNLAQLELQEAVKESSNTN